MTSTAEICRGLTRYIHSNVSELMGKKIVEERGYDHPIYDHEIAAEKAGLSFLLKESTKDKNLKISLGFEMRDDWYCLRNGNIKEMTLEYVKKDFNPDICILSDPIDGSKADVPVFESLSGEPIADGGIYEVFTTAIAFHIDKPTLGEAEFSSIQRWDGKQYFADRSQSYVGYDKKEAIVKSRRLDEIDLRTKLYTAGHYSHVSPISNFVVQQLMEELQVPEKDSMGVRSTGSTTYDMLQPTMTRSVAFDIRDVVKRELEKYGIKMKRGAYTYDFAPPALFAKSAGAKVLSIDGNDLDTNLTEFKTGSYFVAPPGEVGEKLFKILKNRIIPMIPEKVREWKDFYKIGMNPLG